MRPKEAPAINIDDKSREALNSLLKEYPNEGIRLPSLKEEENEEVNSFLDSLGEMLREFIGDSLPEVDRDFFSWSLESIFWTVLAIVLLVVLYYVLKRLLINYSKDESEPDYKKEILQTELDLKLYLKTNQLKKALRSRWKLFLNRSEHNDDLTPYEFIHQEKDLPNSREAALMESYINMFSKKKIEKEHYQHLDDILEDLENKSRFKNV